MTKKIFIGLGCFAILLSAGLSILFYFLFRPSKDDAYLILQNLSLVEGQSCKIEYESNLEDISFWTSDTSIATVKDDQVYALKGGQTFLYAKAVSGKDEIMQIAQVVVFKGEDSSPTEQSYFLKLSNLIDCDFQDGQLNMHASSAAFAIELFDDKDLKSKVEFQELQIFCQDGIECNQEIASMIEITASKSGNVLFVFPKLKFSAQIFVQFAKNTGQSV